MNGTATPTHVTLQIDGTTLANVLLRSDELPGLSDKSIRADLGEPAMLVRQFEEIEFARGDGRTIEGLCVPYNRVATVQDGPMGQPYQEMFVKGAFSRATKVPRKVLVDFEHKTDIGNVLGKGVSFEERDEGLFGVMRIDEHADGDKALQLVRDKVLEGLSVMFKPLKNVVEDGVVKRVVAHLDRMALVRQGAYKEAQVLAVRSAPLLPPPLPGIPDELRASLEHFGINVPGAPASQ